MKIRRFFAFAVAAALLAFACSCDKDDEPEPEPEPTPTQDSGSGTFTSEQEGIVETPAGARIYVPEGAVPRLENGTPGTIVFSLETDLNATVTPPDGEQMASSLYRLGPEGFVFEHPVTVEIPLTEGLEPGDTEVNLYRINQTTGEPEYFAGTYHTDRRTVSAQTHHFSPWFLSLHPGGDTRGTGCAWVTNNSSKWVSLCAVPDSLKYPEIDAAYIPAEGLTSAWAPWDHNIGVTNEGEWWMAQGWYKVCVTYYHDPSENDTAYTHRWLPGQLIVDNSARHNWTGIANWDCTQLDIGGDGISDQGIQDGRCNCTPVPTPPVGTGDIQVTLIWYPAAPRDLDLWVTDPTGEKCFFGNGQAPNVTSTGGQLDQDNVCEEEARPENIYWTQPPPAGEYIVEVHFYSNCGGTETASQSFSVRTVVQGVTRTFDNTVHYPEHRENALEVTRFTIVGGTVTFAEGRGTVPIDLESLPAHK